MVRLTGYTRIRKVSDKLKVRRVLDQIYHLCDRRIRRNQARFLGGRRSLCNSDAQRLHETSTRHGLTSAPPTPPVHPEPEPDTRPDPAPNRSHAVYVNVHKIIGALALDQTGRLYSCRSSSILEFMDTEYRSLNYSFSRDQHGSYLCHYFGESTTRSGLNGLSFRPRYSNQFTLKKLILIQHYALV